MSDIFFTFGSEEDEQLSKKLTNKYGSTLHVGDRTLKAEVVVREVNIYVKVFGVYQSDISFWCIRAPRDYYIQTMCGKAKYSRGYKVNDIQQLVDAAIVLASDFVEKYEFAVERAKASGVKVGHGLNDNITVSHSQIKGLSTNLAERVYNEKITLNMEIFESYDLVSQALLKLQEFLDSGNACLTAKYHTKQFEIFAAGRFMFGYEMGLNDINDQNIESMINHLYQELEGIYLVRFDDQLKLAYDTQVTGNQVKLNEYVSTRSRDADNYSIYKWTKNYTQQKLTFI